MENENIAAVMPDERPKSKAEPKAKPKAKPGRPRLRTCRMDLRLAPNERAKLKRIAKARGSSVTAVLVRLIEEATPHRL